MAKQYSAIYLKGKSNPCGVIGREYAEQFIADLKEMSGGELNLSYKPVSVEAGKIEREMFAEDDKRMDDLCKKLNIKLKKPGI